MKRIRLKGDPLRRPVRPNIYNYNYNGNGTKSRAMTTSDIATKKARKTRKTPVVLEEPVVLKVTRTTKRKASDEAQNINASTDQENLGQVKDEDTEIDLDTIEVRRFLVEPARVNYHYTLGRNVLFQSVSVGCSVTIPCYKEEIPEAMEEAKQIVADRLKIENRKTGAVLDFLVEQRIKKDQELNQRGIR